MKYTAMLTALLLISARVWAADIPVFQPSGGANLDPAAFAQWVDGAAVVGSTRNAAAENTSSDCKGR